MIVSSKLHVISVNLHNSTQGAIVQSGNHALFCCTLAECLSTIKALDREECASCTAVSLKCPEVLINNYASAKYFDNEKPYYFTDVFFLKIQSKDTQICRFLP